MHNVTRAQSVTVLILLIRIVLRHHRAETVHQRPGVKESLLERAAMGYWFQLQL